MVKMVTGSVFEHVLELDLQITSTIYTLEEGIEYLNESNDENPDPTSVQLIESYKKTIQVLQKVHREATDYMI